MLVLHLVEGGCQWARELLFSRHCLWFDTYKYIPICTKHNHERILVEKSDRILHEVVILLWTSDLLHISIFKLLASMVPAQVKYFH